QAAKAMLESTGCDGVMIGRAAQGNPWIFRQTVRFLEDGSLLPGPDKEEKKEIVLRHADMQREVKGEYTAVREMRKHLAWYTTGMPHSARFRGMINSIETFAELCAGVEEIFGA
ncbi:MAG: tRNA-dihydrouridine synthase, partial [Acetatifactor sp.]|nr:tRNA-dihydrouridine synthase [Acetatifactor sp.]